MNTYPTRHHMRTTPLIAAFLTVFMLSSVIAIADTPVKQVALQGRLSDPTGKPLDGSFSVKFEIFASPTEGASGTGLWSEAQKVTVTKGLFGVNLGSATQGGIPLAFDKPYWVEVSIGAEKLSPRYPLTSAPYSFYGGVAGSIDASKIIGTLNINQIPALTADKIPILDINTKTSGTLWAARIPALTADKITSVNPSAIVGTIPDSKIGSVNLIKVYYNTVDSNGQTVANHGIPADSVNGKLSTLNIPSLPSNWAGTIDASRITGLTASMIPSLTSAWTGTIDASKISGALTAVQIPSLPSTWTGTIDASRILSGTLAAARLPTITGSMIGTKAVGTTNIADKGVTQDKLAKRYYADQSDYTGRGIMKYEPVSVISPPASCACSVPGSAVYFCNCHVAAGSYYLDGADIYAAVTKRSDGSDAPIGTAVSWMVIASG
jgi:hypothetical protein